MEMLLGLKMPERPRKYNFDRLKHGDAIRVGSVTGAQEMFRRWRRMRSRKARLISSRDRPGVLFFMDDDEV